MRYHIVAIDYDGTLAWAERVSADTLDILRRVKETGRKIVLVTGRQLEDLESVFPEYKVFDYIVAENGALIFTTETGNIELLGPPPSENFIIALKNNGVHPIATGRIIVATWEPHEKTVLETIKQSGFELQVIFNKGAVMILPPGINKATGLQTLLKSLHFSIHNTAAIGDAENDGAMLEIAEYSAAVENALPALKERADYVTREKNGNGVKELLSKIMKEEYTAAGNNILRHYFHLGKMDDQQDFIIKSYRAGILLGGVSEGGKSTFTSAIAETIIDAGYQLCLLDPEGDYNELPDTVIVGNSDKQPVIEEITELLKNPQQNLIISLLAISHEDRPVFFNSLLKSILELREKYGHPHWLLLDEAHHLIPSHAALPKELFHHFNNFILISTSPHILDRSLLSKVDMVITVGQNKKYVLEQFCTVMECAIPGKIPDISAGQAHVWELDSGKEPYRIQYKLPTQLKHRHKKKYAVGDMAEKSFFFTGPQNKLRLKANNLMMFVQMAKGVDDDTWLYHLKRNDYRNWAANSIQDKTLVEAIQQAEKKYPDVQASKKIIFNYINENYTAA